jgi:hypothetical protein
MGLKITKLSIVIHGKVYRMTLLIEKNINRELK